MSQVLSPKQESLLDTCSYPWWPDLWIMSGIAAGSQQPAASAEGMDLPVALPQLSSFEVLTTPMLAIGGGLQMKRAPPCCLHACPPAHADQQDALTVQMRKIPSPEPCRPDSTVNREFLLQSESADCACIHLYAHLYAGSIALRELPGHILTAAACMPRNIATLQDMSILDVMCGKYLPSRTVTKTS